ncbi:MAG: hypothetical protein DRJ32_03130 [Thermoprotei archaeon]|nr:MAG: hypothetical protein DRJ32_03130 [Thermoprotei archaeon]
MKSLIITKLGGSAITNKHIPFFAKKDVLKNVARDISILMEQYKFIIVHGGGSYGHFIVKKNKLKKKGYANPLVISEINQAMLTLSNIISATFLEKGIPLFTLHTPSILSLEGKKLKMHLRPIEYALNSNLMPMLSGNIVLDKEKNRYAIISGDVIMKLLAKILKPKLAIFGLNVDGLIDPKSGKVIRQIKWQETLKFTNLIMKTQAPDITGGMKFKLLQAAKIAQLGIEVRIGNITKERGLYNLVAGKGIFTKIT